MAHRAIQKHPGRPETRKEILDAARSVFSEKGYHETQIRDIIKKCGCGIGTFYQYFKNKDEIFLEIVGKGSKLLREVLHREVEGLHGVEPTLQRGLKAFLDFVERERAYFVVLFREGYVTSPAVRAVINEATGALSLLMRDMIRRGIQSGEVRKMSEEEIDVVSQCMIGTCMYAATLTVSGYGVAKENMIKHMTNTLVRGIRS
ncbi:MAG: TetR/AcrR family transcriptional regulator [Nitrospirae bacterium]|nr:TetR/AcrR family transcriptional regulator [Nitrospirota bacterium]